MEEEFSQHTLDKQRGRDFENDGTMWSDILELSPSPHNTLDTICKWDQPRHYCRAATVNVHKCILNLNLEYVLEPFLHFLQSILNLYRECSFKKNCNGKIHLFVNFQ